MKHNVFQLRVMMGVMMNDYIKRDDESALPNLTVEVVVAMFT